MCIKLNEFLLSTWIWETTVGVMCFCDNMMIVSLNLVSLNVHYIQVLAEQVHTMQVKPIATRKSSLYFSVCWTFGVECLWWHSHTGTVTWWVLGQPSRALDYITFVLSFSCWHCFSFWFFNAYRTKVQCQDNVQCQNKCGVEYWWQVTWIFCWF